MAVGKRPRTVRVGPGRANRGPSGTLLVSPARELATLLRTDPAPGQGRETTGLGVHAVLGDGALSPP